MAILYYVPDNWIDYDRTETLEELLSAKAAVLALTQMPFQREWAEDLQKIQLKREVAGTSRIEGAEFTDKELDAAIRETPEQLETRSQKQAAAAVAAYRWIAGLPEDLPLNEELIFSLHRRLIMGCDDDHCAPGRLRERDENVVFGAPKHRGAEGGSECAEAFRRLMAAIQKSFRGHDLLVQALAIHYHVAAMHPFSDGNGRTARALEALVLQRSGLRDTLFIAMSNFYYENKTSYLNALNEAGAKKHDLTPFLKFALKGIESQCRRLFTEIRDHLLKALYRNTVTDLFGRMMSPRKRAMTSRHVQLLNMLLDRDEIAFSELIVKTKIFYSVRNPLKALVRDLNYLIRLQAIRVKRGTEGNLYFFSANLDWPMQITETEFFMKTKEMPKGKSFGFLSK